MILLWMRERHEIEATIIERQLPPERRRDRLAGRAAVNENAVALRSFDKNRVSLPDIEESDG